jgi:hypothetical protein
MKYKLLFIVGLTVLLTSALSIAEAAVSMPAFTQSEPKATIETITFNLNENQLQANTAIEAPFGFNAVVPSWPAESESVEIHVRTSKDGQLWGDWVPIQAHDDWNLPEDTETTGDMIVVPEADGLHHFFQYEIHSDDGNKLAELSFTFIDTTEGPTTAEMLNQQQQLDAQNLTAVTDGFPRPAVVSRAVWCIYDTCDDTTDLTYSPATHFIVHHTVSSNDSPSWASTVRAIYIYHRDNLEWGDIGYNYLVDRNGVIYEGHMNEDFLNLDVVGIHAGAANTGSMGTALLGTFTTADEYPVSGVPPYAMLNALANLFAWKADQRDIQIYDASRTATMSWGLPHIMGHRDVYGGTNTLCPGGNTQDLLPWLREEVSTRIGQVSPYTFVSEESSAFTKANVGWFTTERGCGWQGHAYYTWTTTEAADSVNWGEWQINAPESGLYEIQVYAPYCDTNNSETAGATYEIDNGTIIKTAVANHEENVGLWMSLGAYELAAGNNTLRLTDLTTTDSGVGIWFDDIRFKPATDITVTNVAPVNNTWLTNQTVDFEWTIDNPTLVQTVTLEIATNEAFTNVVTSQAWETAVTTTQYTVTQDYPTLYWRVSANTGGATSLSTPTRFGIDSIAPESSVISLTHYAYTNTFDVTWTGSDATSGIDSYNIDYKAESDAAWTRWLTNTTAISSSITLSQTNDLILFRSQAIDQAGNVEAENDGDMRSDQGTIIFNPSVQNNSPLDGWTNNATVLFDWALTEIDEVTNSTIEVATDETFSNIIISEQTNHADSQHEFALTADDGDLYWRVKVAFTPPLPSLTSTVTSEPSWFGLDTTPPTSTVTAVYTLTNNLYLITTNGIDAHSGLSQINLEYQAEGSSDWIQWTGGTVFTPPNPELVYYFRTQALDVAGNLEPPHQTPDMNTSQAKPIPHAIMLPVITK